MPKDYGWNLAVLGLISNLEPLQHHNHCLGLLSERLNADHSTWRFKPNSKPTVSQVTQEPVAALQYGPNIYIYRFVLLGLPISVGSWALQKARRPLPKSSLPQGLAGLQADRSQALAAGAQIGSGSASSSSCQ